MAKTKSADEQKAKPARAAKDGKTQAAGPVSGTRRAPAPADPPAVKEASVSPRARRAAGNAPKAAKAPAKPRLSPGAARADARRAGADLRGDLRAFAEGRPEGWDHADWVTFLEHLRERGHDVSDPDAVGLMLERERLAAVLERVQGMGPRRIAAVVERYDTLWSARHAGADELAALPGMNLSLAEKVRQALH